MLSPFDLGQGKSFFLVACLIHLIAMVNFQCICSSVIIHAHPDHMEATRSQLLAMEGVEIHAIETSGKLIVTLDTQDEKGTHRYLSNNSPEWMASWSRHHGVPPFRTRNRSQIIQ